MTIIDIYSRDTLPLLATEGQVGGREIEWKTMFRRPSNRYFFFLFLFLFSSFFFYFYSSSVLRGDGTRAHGTRNDGVKMGKVEVAAMRSVEMIRTVEQVGGRGIEIFAGN